MLDISSLCRETEERRHVRVVTGRCYTAFSLSRGERVDDIPTEL